MADNATAGAGAAGAADGKAVAPAPVKTSIADPAAVKHTLDEQAVDVSACSSSQCDGREWWADRAIGMVVVVVVVCDGV